MPASFCPTICGACAACVEALAALVALDAIYAGLSDEDRDSLNRRDEDDPRSYALDAKGRP
jgi:hypothetical protein